MLKHNDHFFAAFIITYERAQLIEDTISKLLFQTFPPEKVLVVDNSDTDATKHVIDGLNNPSIVYKRVGYNAGPAGAAKIGLDQLAAEGYQWIFWGDDNDPPKSKNCFEQLFSEISHLDNPGILGAVGHRLNRSTMVIQRTPDERIQKNKWLDVDVISGGMCMIVNADVMRKGVLPDPELFYGFEELDFCLRVKESGYRLWVNCALFQLYRNNSKRSIDRAGKRGLKKADHALWREYYSTRNMLLITKKQQRSIPGMLLVMKSISKIFYGFRFGIKYGSHNAKYIFLGLKDFITGRKGRRAL